MNASPPGLLPVHGASCRCPERERHGGAGESPGFIALMPAAAVAGLPADAAEFVAELNWDGLWAWIAVAGGRVRSWFQDRPRHHRRLS